LFFIDLRGWQRCWFKIYWQRKKRPSAKAEGLFRVSLLKVSGR